MALQDIEADGPQDLAPLNAGLRLLDEAQQERVVIKEEKLDEEDARKYAHAFIEKQKDEIATLKEEKAALQKTLEQKEEIIKEQAARIAELEGNTTPEPAAPAETAAPAEPAVPDEPMAANEPELPGPAAAAAPDETRKRNFDELDVALTQPITENDYKSLTQRITENDIKSNKIRIPRNSTARLLLPDENAKIYVELKGNICAVDWDTGNDRDRLRSGSLLFRKPRLKDFQADDVFGPPGWDSKRPPLVVRRQPAFIINALDDGCHDGLKWKYILSRQPGN